MVISKKFLAVAIATLTTLSVVTMQAERIAKNVFTTAFWSSELYDADKAMAQIEADFKTFTTIKARYASTNISYEDAAYDLATFTGHIKKAGKVQGITFSAKELANCYFVCEQMQQEIIKAQEQLHDFYILVDAFEFYTVKAWHSLVDLTPFYAKIDVLEALLFSLQSRVQLVPHVIKEHDKTVEFEKEKLATEKRKITLEENAQKNKKYLVAASAA